MGELLDLSKARDLREALRQDGKTLVFTNGHFDLLHVGHLDYLEKARTLGDASTARLKGPGRPLVPASERARLLAALLPVTAVIIFEEDTADKLLRSLRPDIYVKGGDYEDKPLPERATVEACGGRVDLIEYLPQRSTTQLINRTRKLP